MTSPSRESSAVSTVIQELQTSPTGNQRGGLQQPANTGGNTRGVNTETVVPNDTLRIEDETSEHDNLPPGIITLHNTMQTGVDRLHRGNHRSHQQNRRGKFKVECVEPIDCTTTIVKPVVQPIVFVCAPCERKVPVLQNYYRIRNLSQASNAITKQIHTQLHIWWVFG